MKIFKRVLWVIVIAIFFLLPIVPDQLRLKTPEQKQAQDEFCAKGFCGLLSFDTPFQFTKESFLNLTLRR